MDTTHRIIEGDARSLASVPDDSVQLVVTSPPYPMIEMWDDQFGSLDPTVAEALAAEDGPAAYEAMHAVLDDVWAEVARVLAPGAIACINIGDATRKLGDSFRVYQNHARVIDAFGRLGFEPLPDILWRKPTNSAAKFMGSGMLPPNAYVTLEHEYILVFRNGSTSRTFEPGSDRRYESAYFWEERNRWFSDVWTELRGTAQALGHEGARDRSAAYPFAVPYRLVNMYSVYGDTVMDPFWGTGTTSLAAMTAARNSIGVELQPSLHAVFRDQLDEVPALSRRVVERRLDRHREFVTSCETAGDDLAYDAVHYDFPVRTKQERSIRLYAVEEVEPSDGVVHASHVPVDAVGEGSPDRR